MSNLTPEEEAVLNALAHEGKEYQNYFFSKAKDLKWFKPLKERGYFKPLHNPPPQETDEKGLYKIPTWPALQYLKKIAPELAKPENEGYAEEVMQVLRDVSRPSSGIHADNYRTWAGFAQILTNVPINLILDSDIELVGVWVKSQFGTSLLGPELRHMVPKCLQSDNSADWRKAERLVEIVTEVQIIQEVFGEDNKFAKKEVHTALDSYSLNELFEHNSALLGKRIGSRVVTILVKRIKDGFTSETHDEFSYIWRKAIEEHSQNVGREDAEQVLISALRDVLCSFASEKPNEAQDLLGSLLSDESVLVRRIALHAVNKNYTSFRELFWKIIGPQWFHDSYKHELYQLLHERFSEFSLSEQAKLLEIIGSLTNEWDDKKEKDRRDMAMRLEWLHAIRGKGNSQVEQLHEEYFEVVQYVPKHPDFSSYVETRWGNLAPASKEQLLALSVHEVASYLKDFRQTGNWDDPTEEGLADLLMQAVKDDPTKFVAEIDAFLGSKLGYQYEILRGLEEAWNANKSFNWQPVLTFCEKVIDGEGFWDLGDKQPDPHLRATRSWITGAICSLIASGVRDDEWAFDEFILPLAERIMLKIGKNEPSTAEGSEDDALTEALNTPKGRCIGALVAYALRKSRLLESKGQNRNACWQSIRPVFDRELDQCIDGNYEFSALAGADILQLHYLSTDWVKERINDIFSLRSDKNWRCAMQGYSYVSVVHPNIYAWLKGGDHLKRALTTNWKNDRVRKRIIEQITVQYLVGEEGLTGSGLFADLVECWNTNDISKVIWQLWTGRKQTIEEEQRQRIVAFWKRCSEKIRTHEDENADILSELTQLTCYLPKIGEGEEAMVVQAAPYVDVRYHSSFFLEYLCDLSPRSPKPVARVFLAMLTRTVPTFEETHIISIVNSLYLSGLKDEANQVANIYAMNGYDFLKTVYSKYNPGR